MKPLFSKTTITFSIIAAFVTIISCNKFKNSPISETYLDTEEPDYGSKATSPDWNSKIHLGRVLFYDKALSLNNSISCASCHKQELAFADNVAQSRGFENKLTGRNSIAIQNLGFSSVFNGGFQMSSPLFWDGRESSLNSLISKPIANHIEMGMDNPETLIAKLNNIPYYKTLVQKAYNVDKIDMTILAEAMVHFINQITTQNSRFDQSKMFNATQLQPLTALEQRGEMLFNNTYNCNRCHNPNPGPYMSEDFANIGLDLNSNDKGRMNVSNASADEGKFKVPDLHNVAVTAPYMHDGRFKTLDDVLEHYSNNIKANSHLDIRLQDASSAPISLNISEIDRKAIIAFLGTMTDYKTMTNPNLSSPFKSK